jgi:sugar phosphate isomerase/epimerase
MNSYFVNLPVRYIAEDHSYLEFFLNHRLSPELGLDPIALDQFDLDWHARLADSLRENGMQCSIHLPFHDLQPGSIDDLILEATRTRLKKSMQVAKVYEPKFLVAHAYFIPLYSDLFSKWFNRAWWTWRQVLDEWPEHPPLYLENVREKDPRPLGDILSELARFNVKFCFDVGHWSSYGSGGQYQNLSFWIQTMAPFLEHLHLHDNDGIADQHLGLGQGAIPWAELFAGIELLELSPGVTLEPHSEEDLNYSLAFMRQHSLWFSRLGVHKQQVPAG